MRVLILDDDNFRHKIFKQRFAEHDVRHAHTYHEFRIDLDRGSPWDLIYLDHDLGEMEHGDTYTVGT